MIGIKLYCCLKILTVFFVTYSDSYVYVPPDRKIEVVDKEEYFFGIEEDFGDDSIIKCYYSTDTGISGSFDVGFGIPIVRNNYTNIITNRGKDGLCQINVANVDDTGPGVWTIIPTVVVQEGETEKEQNLTAVTFNVTFFYRAPLLEYLVEVLKFSNFYNHMKLPSNVTLVSCNVKFRDAIIDLDVNSPQANSFISPYSWRDDEVSNKIESLGRGLCGLKVSNATNPEIYPLKMTLTAVNNQGKHYRESFSIRVSPQQLPVHTQRSVVMGNPYTLKCGHPIIQPFCTLYNPAGYLMHTKDCTYEIPTVSMEHLGTWKCYSGNSNTMESIEFAIELIGKGPEHVETWQNETDTHLNIGCRMANYRGVMIRFCVVTAPSGRTYNVKPGLATDRYIALGTNFLDGMCWLQIKKPLEVTERGRWKCELVLQYREPEGGFLKIAEITPPDYPKHLKIITNLNKTFTINCEVPYSSEYCRVQAPNGTRYIADHESEVTLGRCSLVVQEAVHSDNGTWICLFARETGQPDEEIITEVSVAEVLRYYKSVEVDTGDRADMICSTDGPPLLYCRFVSPTGTSYHIKNHENSSTISYYGRGLEYGDCGITIASVKPVDNGFWSCVTKLFTDEKTTEISAQILLSVAPYLMDGPNLAGIGIGIAVGVVVISSIIGIIAVNRWKHRSHADLAGSGTGELQPTDGDNVSNNSQTIFTAGPPPRSYTNPQPIIELEDPEHPHHL